jgi:hypothetical protein
MAKWLVRQAVQWAAANLPRDREWSEAEIAALGAKMNEMIQEEQARRDKPSPN